jgi:hypothetical protein
VSAVFSSLILETDNVLLMSKTCILAQNLAFWSWCYVEVEQFSVDLQVGHFPTPFYLFSEISCLRWDHSVVAYWVQALWGWNHWFSSGIYDVCYRAEVSHFLMPPLFPHYPPNHKLSKWLSLSFSVNLHHEIYSTPADVEQQTWEAHLLSWQLILHPEFGSQAACIRSMLISDLILNWPQGYENIKLLMAVKYTSLLMVSCFCVSQSSFSSLILCAT